MHDHPDIERCERTGFPYAQEMHEPVCPVCGEPCDRYYELGGEIVCCDVCFDDVIKEVDAWGM